MSGEEKIPEIVPFVAFNGSVVRQEVAASEEGADTRLGVWSALRNLQHKTLLKIYECGETTVNGQVVLYCVREASDGDLESALATGPLETEAAIELVGALLRVLDYLHAHGLVCSGITPSEVHACGSSTKLLPQRLRHDTSVAERAIDLRSLGELIVKVTAGSAGIDEMRDPRLRSLALKLLNSSDGTASAEAALRVFEPRRQTRNRAFGVAAALVVLGLFFGVRNYYGSHQPTNGLPPTVDKRPSPIDSAQPLREPEETAPVPVQRPSQRLETAANASREQERSRSGASEWAVIAATYKSFGAAQRRANSLKAAFGDCTCSVFPRDGEGQNYYVVVASNLTGDAAEIAKKRAIEAGLPNDTYVTRLAPKRPEASNAELP